VETSGRSSAHSNAYDALNSIQDCTAPAATQLRTAAAAPQPKSSDLFQADSPLTDHSKIKEVLNNRGWEGLASFIFGPDWFSIPLEGEDNNNTDEGNVAASKGGTTSLAAGGGGKEKQSNGKATITKAPGGKGLTNNSGGKGKQLSNMAGNPNVAANENNNNRKRSVSFSVDRQSSNITDGGGMMDDGSNMMNDNGSLNNDAVILGRWHAPYLKDIPTFPITGLNPEDNIANPHRLPGSQISLSMHDYATEMEACRESTTSAALKRRGSSSDAASSATAKAKKLQIDMAEKAMIMALRIPDDVYAKKDMVWGAIKDSNVDDDDTLMTDADSKKSAGEKKLDSGKATTTAKVKFDPSTKQQSETPSLNELSGPQIHRPSYVPKFLPPFPTNEYSDLADERLTASISTTSVMGDVMSRMHHRSKEKRKASDISSTSADDNDQKKKINSFERDSVRRSVIGLGKKSVGTSYWGSNWLDDDNTEAGGGTHTKTNNIGLSDVTGALVEEGGNTVAAASPKKSNSDVQPLVRASGSRLSKILEGSMI